MRFDINKCTAYRLTVRTGTPTLIHIRFPISQYGHIQYSDIVRKKSTYRRFVNCRWDLTDEELDDIPFSFFLLHMLKEVVIQVHGVYT